MIIDYGASNIRSIENALREVSDCVRIANKSADIEDADRIVLPGVGVMPRAMKHLNDKGFTKTLNQLVQNQNVPILGICLGMQLMCRLGHEGVPTTGLDWFDAEVTALTSSPRRRVPHMGWMELENLQCPPIFDSLPKSSAFYFCHSYAVKTLEKETIASVFCGDLSITAGLWKGSAIGLQFHPELSGNNGLQIIENFLSWDGKGRQW